MEDVLDNSLSQWWNEGEFQTPSDSHETVQQYKQVAVNDYNGHYALMEECPICNIVYFKYKIYYTIPSYNAFDLYSSRP